MKTREQIEETFKDAAWYAYKQGFMDGVNEENSAYWNRFRNEAASRNLQTFLGNNEANVEIGKMVTKPEEGIMLQAKMAVMYADALVHALQKKPEWTFEDEKQDDV